MDAEKTNEEKTQETAPESTATASEEEIKVAEAAIALLPAEDESTTDDKLTEKSTKILGDITAQRAVRRALRAETAAIQAENAALKAQPPQAPEKSPMDKFVEEHPGEVPTGEVHQAESKFQAKNQAAAAEQSGKESRRASNQQVVTAAVKEAQGLYADYDEITDAGEEYLTPGDIVDIKGSAEPAKLLYEKSIERILRAGGEAAKQLRTRLTSKSSASAKPASKEKVTGGSEKDEEGETKPPTKNVNIARLHSILA